MNRLRYRSQFHRIHHLEHLQRPLALRLQCLRTHHPSGHALIGDILKSVFQHDYLSPSDLKDQFSGQPQPPLQAGDSDDHKSYCRAVLYDGFV